MYMMIEHVSIAVNAPVEGIWDGKEGKDFIAAVTITHNLPDRQVMTIKCGKSGS